MSLTSKVRACAFVCLLVPSLVACGSSNDGNTGEKQQGPKDNTPDDPAPQGELKELIARDWTMPPGKEGYVCAKKTIDHDMYITGFEAINPKGTHHTLLTHGDPVGEDGVYDCTVADNRTISLFGSGVGTDPLNFPEGMAIRVEKGQQLLLNLHLFNTSDEPMPGYSGTQVREIDEADVTDLAEGLLAGTVLISVPPQETKTTTGYCKMSQDFTLFAVAPHMHQLGIYEKAIVEHQEGGEVTLMDQPYSFDEQSYHLIDPVAVKEGDKVRVECTHKNTTSKTVTFGESSLSEMCFAGLYRFPAVGSSIICTTDFPGAFGGN